MICGRTGRVRVPIDTPIITYWYWLSSINYKLFVWSGLRAAKAAIWTAQGKSKTRTLKTVGRPNHQANGISRAPINEGYRKY